MRWRTSCCTNWDTCLRSFCFSGGRRLQHLDRISMGWSVGGRIGIRAVHADFVGQRSHLLPSHCQRKECYWCIMCCGNSSGAESLDWCLNAGRLTNYQKIPMQLGCVKTVEMSVYMSFHETTSNCSNCHLYARNQDPRGELFRRAENEWGRLEAPQFCQKKKPSENVSLQHQ